MNVPHPMARRTLLAGLLAACALVPAGPGPAGAQAADAPAAFIRQFADALVAVVNGPQPTAEKRASLGPVIDRNVDVATIARFCLGRAWNSATPQQQQSYTQLFHGVLLNNIGGHLGEYRGVSYTLGGTQARGANSYVSTTISRPNAQPVTVQWVVSGDSGSPKVIDVIAEGTSLRLTTRSDYASYLEHHGGDVDALIAALKRQLAS